MATVRLSMGLKESIVKNATKAFDAAYPKVSASKEDQTFVQQAIKRSTFYRTLESVHKSMQGIKSRNSLGVQSSQFGHHRVRTLSFYDTRENNVGFIEFDDDFMLTVCAQHYMAKDTLRFYLDDLDVDDYEPTASIIKNLKREQEELSDKRKSYVNQLTDLLNRCTTLKQAIKVWPGLETFVPSSALSKHHEKPPAKTTQAKVNQVDTSHSEPVFDVSVANEVAVRARLLGGA